MKILLVDMNFRGGHHEVYMRSIINNTENTYVTLLNKKYDINGVKGYVTSFDNHSIVNLLKMYKTINRIIQVENIDIIHFLEGDYFVRYCGLGLSTIKNLKIVITYHHIFENKMKIVSYLLISSKVASIVVHTDYITERMKLWGVKNVRCIDYPHFETEFDTVQFQLKNNTVKLLAFGGTRYNKGLDILLDALKGCACDFELTIAGNEEDITKENILELIESYKDKVIIKLDYISDEDMNQLFKMTDIVVLPYRKKFSGASGPMTDGVWNGKMIIGPKCKSIGYIIDKYDLGYTFEPENVESLKNALVKGIEHIKKGFYYSESANSFRDKLSEKKFDVEYEKLYREIEDFYIDRKKAT